jgi:hypothetical protein
MQVSTRIRQIKNPNTIFLSHFDSLIDETGNNTIVSTGGILDTNTKKWGEKSLKNTSGSGVEITGNLQSFNWTGNWTIDCWIYVTTPLNASRIFLAYSTTLIKGVFISLGGIVGSNFKILVTNGTGGITSSGTFSSNIWHHLMVINQPGVAQICRLYMNGVFQGTANPFTATTTCNNICIGIGHTGSYNSPFVGYIDEFRIDKTAITSRTGIIPNAPYTY